MVFWWFWVRQPLVSMVFDGCLPFVRRWNSNIPSLKSTVGTASMHYWRPIFEAKLIDFQQFCFRFTLIFIQSVPWMKHRRNLQNVLTLCDFVSIFGKNLWGWRFDLGKALIHYSLWTELQILIRIHIRHSPILPQHPDFHFLTRVISADINIVHC